VKEHAEQEDFTMIGAIRQLAVSDGGLRAIYGHE
jgi:hypothetical protein